MTHAFRFRSHIMDTRSSHFQPEADYDHDRITAAILSVAPAYCRTGTAFDYDLRANIAAHLVGREEIAPSLVLSAMSDAYSKHARSLTPVLASAIEALGESDRFSSSEYVADSIEFVGGYPVGAADLASGGECAPCA